MSIFKQVEQFNNTAGVQYELEQGLLKYKDFVNRNAYLKEEQSEYMTAYLHKNREEVLDALTDMMYIIAGTAERMFGAEVCEEAFKRVHENNMRKFPETFEEALFSRESYFQQGVDVSISQAGGGRWKIVEEGSNKVKKPVGFKAVELGDLVK
jgi:NTP pyrophosphatase (non-canonical NTP hydrolase)